MPHSELVAEIKRLITRNRYCSCDLMGLLERSGATARGWNDAFREARADGLAYALAA
jgi:hypothetical protein